MYVSECFRADARSTALAISTFANWTASLLLTLLFPYIAKLLGDYTFLIFTAICALAVTIIILKVKNSISTELSYKSSLLSLILSKVPETKGRNAEEIIAEFNHREVNRSEDASGKLMSTA